MKSFVVTENDVALMDSAMQTLISQNVFGSPQEKGTDMIKIKKSVTADSRTAVGDGDEGDRSSIK